MLRRYPDGAGKGGRQRPVLLVGISAIAFLIGLLVAQKSSHCQNLPFHGSNGANTSLAATLTAAYSELQRYQQVLDVAAGGRNHIVGNVLWYPEQTLFYAASVHGVNVKTVCEIGYGAGHSSVLYLNMNPNINLYTFDIFDYGLVPFQDEAIKYLRDGPHGARWHLVKGDSAKTVPEFAAANPGLKCDVIHVDGDHSAKYVYLDTKNMARLAHPNTVLLLDDMNMEVLRGAVENAARDGIIYEPECRTISSTTDSRFATLPDDPKTFCYGFYTFPS